MDIDAALGISQEFLVGGRQSKPKVYSLSLFLLDSQSSAALKYQRYAKLCIDSLLQQNPDWGVRLYIDPTVSNTYIAKAFGGPSPHPNLQVIRVRMHRYPANYGLLPVLFRYIPMFDPGVEVCLFRDIDNVWTDQDRFFVDTWLDSDCELTAALNDKYLRQQVKNAAFEYEDRFFSCIFAGLWGIRKRSAIPASLWQFMFAYLEFSTDFIPRKQNRFYYGFDEILLSRICIPYFLSLDYKCLGYPIRIYDPVLLANMTNPALIPATPSSNAVLRTEMRKLIAAVQLPFSGNVSDVDRQISTCRDLLVNRYWDIATATAGEAQYLLVVLSHLYFYILSGKYGARYSRRFMTVLRYLVYPIPAVISCGLFTFGNIYLSQWLEIKAAVLKYLDESSASTGGLLIPVPPPYDPDVIDDGQGGSILR